MIIALFLARLSKTLPARDNQLAVSFRKALNGLQWWDPERQSLCNSLYHERQRLHNLRACDTAIPQLSFAGELKRRNEGVFGAGVRMGNVAKVV
jgi:hypothetical protein